MRAQWWIVGLVTVLATFGAARCSPPREAKRVEVVRAPLSPDDALTDNQPALPRGKVPAKPYEWQKRPSGNPPKCGPKEVLISGACYRRAHPDDYSPPCEPPTVEHAGQCFYAIHKPERPPASIGR